MTRQLTDAILSALAHSAWWVSDVANWACDVIAHSVDAADWLCARVPDWLVSAGLGLAINWMEGT